MDFCEDVLLPFAGNNRQQDPEPPRATPHRIFSVLDILHMTAEQLQGDNRALCNFSRVSKAFHLAGIPVLYREIRLPLPVRRGFDGPSSSQLQTDVSEDEGDYGAEQILEELRGLRGLVPRPHNRNLCWVRTLRCGFSQFADDELTFELVVPTVLNLQEELLEKLTGLTTYECLWVPPNPPDISRLKDCCPNISALTIIYPDWTVRPNDPDLLFYFSPLVFEVFQGLSRLCLLNMQMHGDFRIWRRRIVSTLCACPGLTSLSLGFDPNEPVCEPERGHGSVWEPYQNRDEEVWDIFRQVCYDFAANGALPLRLQYLNLHYGFWLLDSSAFRLLADPFHLEKMHLDNKYGWKRSLDLSPFSKTACPRLKQLTFGAATPALCAWLVNMPPDFSEQVAVYFSDTGERCWAWYDQGIYGLKMVPRHFVVPPMRGFQLGWHLRCPIDNLDRLAHKIASVHGHCLEELMLLHESSLAPIQRAALEFFQCTLVSRLPKLQDVVLWSPFLRENSATCDSRQRIAYMLALASGFQSRLRRIMLAWDVAVELVRRPGEHGFGFRQMTECEIEQVPLFMAFRDEPLRH